MSEHSQITPRPSNGNGDPVFYLPPASLEEALIADIEAACATHKGVLARLAHMCNVEEKTVYAWKRPNHIWTTEKIKAVLMVTGGAHYRAFCEVLAADAPVIDSSEKAMRQNLKEAAVETIELVEHISESMAADDDTPGVMDSKEKREALARIGAVEARLAKARIQVETA